ncbi:MAG: VOC family protein [Planctomycetota bacterium]
MKNWIRRLALLPPEEARCSFCDTLHEEAGPFAEGPSGAFICEQCIATCATLIAHEKVRRKSDSGITHPRTLFLSAARVFVRDVTEAEDFYLTKLGLPLIAGGVSDNYLVFLAGSMHLIVESVEAEAREVADGSVGRFTGLSFAVASVEDTYTELSSLGVCFTGKPEVQPWGGILATFKDPAGNELQIVQHPAGP